jgi:hypothetical protein
MKYLASDANQPLGSVEHELESWLDRVQPAWPTHLLTRRTLPLMTVTHALPVTDKDGLRGRPGIDVTGYSGVYLAGDWVGSRGQLADAAAASAEEAAGRVLARAASPLECEVGCASIAGKPHLATPHSARAIR